MRRALVLGALALAIAGCDRVPRIVGSRDLVLSVTALPQGATCTIAGAGIEPRASRDRGVDFVSAKGAEVLAGSEIRCQLADGRVVRTISHRGLLTRAGTSRVTLGLIDVSPGVQPARMGSKIDGQEYESTADLVFEVLG